MAELDRLRALVAINRAIAGSQNSEGSFAEWWSRRWRSPRQTPVSFYW